MWPMDDMCSDWEWRWRPRGWGNARCHRATTYQSANSCIGPRVPGISPLIAPEGAQLRVSHVHEAMRIPAAAPSASPRRKQALPAFCIDSAFSTIHSCGGVPASVLSRNSLAYLVSQHARATGQAKARPQSSNRLEIIETVEGPRAVRIRRSSPQHSGAVRVEKPL